LHGSTTDRMEDVTDVDTAERTVLSQTQIGSMAAVKLNDHRRRAQLRCVDQVGIKAQHMQQFKW